MSKARPATHQLRAPGGHRLSVDATSDVVNPRGLAPCRRRLDGGQSSRGLTLARISYRPSIPSAQVDISRAMSTLSCGLRWLLGVRVVDMSATERADRRTADAVSAYDPKRPWAAARAGADGVGARPTSAVDPRSRGLRRRSAGRSCGNARQGIHGAVSGCGEGHVTYEKAPAGESAARAPNAWPRPLALKSWIAAADRRRRGRR